MRCLAHRIRSADLTVILPILAVLALSAQMLLPLRHALELSSGHAQTAANCTVGCGETAGDERCPTESAPEQQPREHKHDPSTCPTCQQIFLAKTFGTPTLLAPTEVIEAGEWRLELALEAQIHRLDHPRELSARAPPSC